jgi:hypothetical protein
MAFIRLVFRRGNGVAGCVTSVKHNHLSRHLLLEQLRERGDGCRNDCASSSSFRYSGDVHLTLKRKAVCMDRSLPGHPGTDGQPREWKMKLSGIDWDRNSRDYSRRLNCDLVNRWMRTVAVNL